MYSEEAENNIGIHIENHDFDEGSSLSGKTKTQPYISFLPSNINSILEGKEIIVSLYEPFKGYKCDLVLINDVHVEFTETTLSEEGIWNDENTLKNGVLYGK